MTTQLAKEVTAYTTACFPSTISQLWCGVWQILPECSTGAQTMPVKQAATALSCFVQYPVMQSKQIVQHCVPCPPPPRVMFLGKKVDLSF
jgi:hypothetical protein